MDHKTLPEKKQQINEKYAISCLVLTVIKFDVVLKRTEYLTKTKAYRISCNYYLVRIPNGLRQRIKYKCEYVLPYCEEKTENNFTLIKQVDNLFLPILSQ